MDKDFKKQEKRIESVFAKESDDIFKNEANLKIYKDYLDDKLEFPVKLTGIEDFDWEEFYLLGPGSKKEYETLIKTRPSYMDIFDLTRISDKYDEHLGLFAIVKRESDKKTFQIPLADLKALDRLTVNYQLLDDYSVWCINY